MTLNELFKNKKKNLLNIYFTAGYPKIDSLPEILESLEESGVDMVEIGLPYSDPLSDGPTIQQSSSIAIKNGITTELVFQQLKMTESTIPKIIMGYFNAVFLYGVEEFCKKCKEVGVSGIILPDLPMDIYKEKYEATFEQYDLSFISLVTPETSDERFHQIDENSTSFIYAVSSSSTTGKGNGIQSSERYLKRLKEMKLKHPLMVGFNISEKEDFEFATKYTSGGIIGSAFIKHISNSNNLKEDIHSFINNIRKN